MTPIQQLMLGVGASKKTYMDDVFSTYLYDGNSTTLSVNSGVDNTKGGMIWFKARSETERHLLFDTERGTSNYIESNSTAAQTSGGAALTSFDNDGYTLGASAYQNNSGRTYTSWNFRKAPGFFDVVTYTGNSTAGRQVSHNLGSIPGLMMVKCTSSAGEPWYVYHKDLGATKHLKLNTNSASSTSSEPWNNTEPTSTHFTLAQYNSSNGSGKTYVAYLFAGGESTAATARSVEFDGTGDTLTLASSSDFNFGTGDFTFEGWLKPNNNTDFQIFLNWGSDNPSIGISNDNNSYIYYNSTVNTKIAGIAAVGQWTHYAISRSSGTTRLFLNGELKNSFSDSHNYGAQALSIGGYSNETFNWNGRISNVRIVKGTALYTSSFRPSTVPFTNITNTKLLCCNNSVTSGSTVTPGTISVGGNPQASTDSPFDDPAGFVFGENEDENVIKCGSVTLPSGETNIAAYLGFEPQWLMFKQSDGTDDWDIYDTMRGWKWNKPSDGSSLAGSIAETLEPNTTDAEANRYQATSVRSTGFHIDGVGSGSKTFIYMAIRRPDGYVQKPVEDATKVFALATGTGNATANFASGFPVDYLFTRDITGTGDMYSAARLTGKNYIITSSTAAENSSNAFVFDSNVGSCGSGLNSTFRAWQFKRHAGFDVVTYEGNQVSREVKHNLNAVPEMIWSKDRSQSGDWVVYHKGLNAGTSGETPAHKFLYLNKTDAENGWVVPWNDTEPTSVWYPVQASNTFNKIGNKYLTMLFASVSGVSKVGSFNGSTSNVVVNTGFQPRMIIIKKINNTGDWGLFDSLRGLGSSNDPLLRLNTTATQNVYDYLDISSTGFTVTENDWRNNGDTYIYYAHA